jgi:glycosyltransferase involved in cell wall biosynthesis
MNVKLSKSETNKYLISVVIAVGREDIEETLDSLENQTLSKDNFEIILVSELNNLKILETSQIRFIHVNERNPAIKRNIGVKEAKGELIAFIDDDAIAPVDWLEKGYNTLKDNSDFCGLGGPNLIPPNANKKEQLTDIILNSSLLGAGHISYSGKYAKREAKLGEIHLVNLFVWKDAFLRVGGLNENIGYGGEDTEFIYQIKKKLVKRFFYDSEVYVYHHRREFGWSYVKQRFKLRINNGKMIWAYPKLYLSNIKFLMLIIGTLALIMITLKNPVFLFYIGLVYFLFLSIYTILKHKNYFPILPVAFFLHHLTYIAGVFYGLIIEGIKYKYIKQIRR